LFADGEIWLVQAAPKAVPGMAWLLAGGFLRQQPDTRNSQIALTRENTRTGDDWVLSNPQKPAS